MVRKGSTVRVRQRASAVCRGLFSDAVGRSSAEVPNGYVLTGSNRCTDGGQHSGSRLFTYVRSNTPAAGAEGHIGPSSLCGSDMSTLREATFLRPSEAAEITGFRHGRSTARSSAARVPSLTERVHEWNAAAVPVR